MLIDNVVTFWLVLPSSNALTLSFFKFIFLLSFEEVNSFVLKFIMLKQNLQNEVQFFLPYF